MKFSDVYALGPLDGRYRPEVAPLIDHLSEQALNRARAHVEVEWLIFLSTNRVLPGAPVLTDADIAYLRAIPTDMDDADIARLAVIEAETRHDVKAVEYFLKEKMDAAPAALGDTTLPQMHEIVHIFATSEDINNLSYALIIKDALTQVWLPAARALVADLEQMAATDAATPMLSHTHGQPASPTTLGKEVAVLAHRLARQVRRIEAAEFLGKFNGATGTYGAHSVSVPGADWPALARQFVEGLGLTFNPLTTQIESHDWMSELFADVARFNRIAHNLATDFWTYISLGYLAQNLAAQGSTGSSTMPHKVNPIRFENAEANLEISCALLDTLGATLVTSRLQRDLTDSSTLRNVGVAFGHSLLAITNLRRGVAGVEANRAALDADLEAHWEVLGEPIQQAMRAAAIAGATGMQDPYERLKELTRGHQVGAEEMRAFIGSLGLPDDVAARLANLTPATYVGLAPKLVR
ncbi:adenylosuccinate lyase [Trueperella bernardiae]|uniref:Adenylosuccinate lyase n=1 Tax=Trueperella bernardiae TaxID=59561 RepID=A0A0W1KIV1_9ACTO|nr:adenylosuccinate lyase [Trueperella bernardiae]KTF03529.1 Adenylosuccinate lyase [Trueperella bernardiae]MDK8601988.1 adenylosuccinate lyase [Trueperella bernardiae]OCW60197.1 adenylosuccinate lyase [Trueperella bernardiae]PKZ88599.1 adenylosuccinate lyase [Trueperella bernardiae]